MLGSAAGQALGLTVHELATNSAKYGALSVDRGRVTVAWSATDEGAVLEWAESGGPVIQAPVRTGFGIKLINGEVEGQLGGRITYDWRPEGLLLRVVIKRKHFYGDRVP